MNDRIIQFTRLGRFGRFGNQLFQYAFARAYTEKYNAILECPYWVGEKIFKDVECRRPSCPLPMTKIDKIPWGEVNIDLYGYFQKKRFLNILSTNKLMEWFAFQNKWNNNLGRKREKLVAHLRGGFPAKFTDGCAIINRDSYLNACNKFGLEKESIFWVGGGYDIHVEELEFVPDFLTMVNAETLLRSNSTFSFWAGFFNTTGKVFSPVVGEKVGSSDVDFTEGNFPKLVPHNDDMFFGK